MDYEKEIIASCLQDDQVLKDLINANLTSKYFNNNFHQIVVDSLFHLYEIDNITESAIKQTILEDKSLSKQKKKVFVKKVDNYYTLDTEDTNLSFERFLFKKRKKDLFDAISEGVHQFEEIDGDEDINEVINNIERKISEVRSVQYDFDMFNFWDSWDERQQYRFEVAVGESGSLKFCKNLSKFQKYFPRNLSAGETTSVAGPTYAGKSLMAANFVRMSVMPENGLDTIYIVTENRKEQAYSRLDAMVLGESYDNLFKQEYIINNNKADFFSSVRDKGWGELQMVKVHPGDFDVGVIQTVVDRCRNQGMDPKVLVIDSPDHQQSSIQYGDYWRNKGQVYMDNKDLVEREELVLIVSTPMKASSKKKDPENEQVAGSYDIARIVDNIIMFNVSEEDKDLNRVRLQVTKSRDGNIDNKDLSFMIDDDLVLKPWKNQFADVEEKKVKDYEKFKGKEN